jgi:hypothetical protein
MSFGRSFASDIRRQRRIVPSRDEAAFGAAGAGGTQVVATTGTTPFAAALVDHCVTMRFRVAQ